jgi:hypothetical protein
LVVNHLPCGNTKAGRKGKVQRTRNGERNKNREERNKERRMFHYYETGGFMYKKDRNLPISL